MAAPKQSNNPMLAGLRSWAVKGFEDMRIYYVTQDTVLRVVPFCTGNGTSTESSNGKVTTKDGSEPAFLAVHKSQDVALSGRTKDSEQRLLGGSHWKKQRTGLAAESLKTVMLIERHSLIVFRVDQ